MDDIVDGTDISRECFNMLVYVDASCFNRPFDDQQQERVHRETEAVLSMLQRVVSGDDELVWSPALTIELSAHPESEIREQLLAWSAHARIGLSTTAAVHGRIKELAKAGFKSLDAAHVAFAEAANSGVLLTCDDRFLRRAQGLGRESGRCLTFPGISAY